MEEVETIDWGRRAGEKEGRREGEERREGA